MQAGIAIVNGMVLKSPRELAISALMLAESSHFSGFLLNGHGQMPQESIMCRRVSPNIGVVRHKEGDFDGKGSHTDDRYLETSRRHPGRQP
jgi:hypothetical protein